MNPMYIKPFGLDIQSVIPLPGCVDTESTPDVSIRFGAVPDSLPNASTIRACTQARPGQFLLIVDRVAKYLVENGDIITIQPAPGATEDEIRLFLMGSAWSALLLQRGLLPLHGSAVQVNDKAFVLAGPSGNGKSTLAAALMNRGFPLIADELCALVIKENSPPLLLPGFPQILLWADSLQILGKDPQFLTPVRPGLEKYTIFTSGRSAARTPSKGDSLSSNRHPAPRGPRRGALDPAKTFVKPRRTDQCAGIWSEGPFSVPPARGLERIYILTVVNTPSFKITPLKGVNKVHALIDCTYRVHHVAGLGLNSPHFKQCTNAARFIDIKRVERPGGLNKSFSGVQGPAARGAYENHSVSDSSEPYHHSSFITHHSTSRPMVAEGIEKLAELLMEDFDE